jgi:hypothetical protein
LETNLVSLHTGHVRLCSSVVRLFRNQNQAEGRPGCSSAELRGGLEQAPDGTDAGGHPLGRWQAHPEDDAMGTSAALCSTRKVM